jgi:predicted dehydrogenase
VLRIGIVTGAGLSHGPAFAGIINGGSGAPPQDMRDDFGDVRVTCVWDKEPGVAEKLAAEYGIDRVAASPEDVAGSVDAILVLDDGTMQHQRQARPSLERGMPTFVDKPLSPDPAEAAELVALARRHDAPFMSCSALRFARELIDARAQLDAIKPFAAACAVGPHELIYYGIHPCELLQAAIGSGVRAVQNVGAEGRHIVRLFYGDERSAVLQVFEDIGYVFHLNVYGKGGWVSFAVADHQFFYTETMRQFVAMCRGGAAPFPPEDTLEIIETLWCARKSAQEGGRIVRLEEVSGGQG